ncbi:hypothetical protein [Streptomyces sp. A0642]|uniref:hypothetical protein n=1 Tax=Streptomyces sp. A0642 TaxID=2563100 RepID=UPI001F10CB11|nr:hypothetical protein [Streptomyces sp. A0642]
MALDLDVTVIRGARGAGKTVWFKALQDERLREVAAHAYQLARIQTVEPIAVYGSELRPESYPGPATLVRLADSVGDPYNIWVAVMLNALGMDEIKNIGGWIERVEWVKRNPEELDRLFAEADSRAGASGNNVVLLFDALDRVHPQRAQADKLVSGVLRLALDIRTRTRNLRAKIFIRHDMFDAALLQFPDASKLTANAADLTWTETNLYGLLYHQLGNSAHEYSTSFRDQTGAWEDAGEGRYLPPPNVVGDRETQKEIFTQLAGPYMGTEHRKGLTYTWLPNHLMDGVGQVSPRSFLSALSKATDVTRTRFAGNPRALHYDGIRQGVQAASDIRVREVAEDLPWVQAAIKPLAGLQVPIEEDAILDRWRGSNLLEELSDLSSESENVDDQIRTGPRSVDDTAGLIEELILLGVMSRRGTGRIDLPDVYRIAFDIGRRGGVPRNVR